jgi:hypothetical protein
LKGAYPDHSFITKRIQHLTLSKIMRSKPVNNTFTGTAVRTHEQRNGRKAPAVRTRKQPRSEVTSRTTRHRPSVERVIAQVATFCGRRLKLRYRGVAKNPPGSSAAPPR